ncbi:nuclease-related domain-containing protein [Nocardia fluminea]|uniref:nuclease-related domain-containing protein n=1 Tax=Nocardia fluminea TaxID=134984 RepID=UPI0033DC5E9A
MTQLFLGAPIREPSELRFLRRLRDDLAVRGVAAIVLANFVADPGRASRQVDFLVCTRHRLVHVELKTLDTRAPLDAPANGHWTQHLPAGQSRTLSNGSRQALETTYAISDHLRRIASAAGLPTPQTAFYRHIDTVVCFQPEIPQGSSIEPIKHVSHCSYAELLVRLGQDGASPPGWSAAEMELVAQKLGLFAEQVNRDEANANLTDLNQLASYRSRLCADLERDLHELVPLRMRVEAGDWVTGIEVLKHCIASGEVVTVSGISGTGKTHAVKHAVLIRSRMDAVPVWLSCRDYEGDTFPVAMAKGVARFTSHRWSDLFHQARRQGQVPVIVLDGLGECSPEQQRVLLEGVRAYRNLNPCAVVATDQCPPAIDASQQLVSQIPDDAERDLLLDSYGAPQLRGTEGFTTAWDLAMASQCASQLPLDASAIDVVDTYCRRLSRSEVERDQLRALAVTMRRAMRLSMHLSQLRSAILTELGRPATADELDMLLGSKLLRVGPQRVSFAHESLTRFLAAQHLTLNARDGAALAQVLQAVALTDLSDLAFEVEPDPARRLDALMSSHRPDLLTKAACGGYGPTTELRVLAEIRRVLSAMSEVTKSACFVFDRDSDPRGFFGGRWERPRITAAETALLRAAGRCLIDGVLVEELSALLDATDAVSADAMNLLRAAGNVSNPISVVVASTCAPGLTQGRNIASSTESLVVGDLPATTVLRSANDVRFQNRRDSEGSPRASLLRFATAATPRWCRLSASIMILNVRSDQDLDILPKLLSEAWTVGGYHLRLDALEAAHTGARWMDQSAQARLRNVLEDIDVRNNWALSSLHLEALAACGAVEPIATEANIRADIENVLDNLDDPRASGLARSILGQQFEDEAIFGPVSEVVDTLTPEKLVQLCGVALRDEDAVLSITRDWAVARIADHIHAAGPPQLRLIAQIAADPPADSVTSWEGVRAHLEALRGWASIEDRLPDAAAAEGDAIARTWRLIDELIFPLLAGTVASKKREIWLQLQGPCRPIAADALLQVRVAQSWSVGRGTTIYQKLELEYPTELKTMFEWALDHWDELRPAVGQHMRSTRDGLLGALSNIGDDRTRAIIEGHLNDPEIAHAAVAALRGIDSRRTAPG